MDHASFLTQVLIMRTLQKEFFRTRPEDRKPDLIRRAKEAEKQVDEAIAAERAELRQRSLFEKTT